MCLLDTAVSRRETDELIEMPFWFVDLGGAMESLFRWEPGSPGGRTFLWEHTRTCPDLPAVSVLNILTLFARGSIRFTQKLWWC